MDSLKKKIVSDVIIGSRVVKYKHRFCNTEFSQLHLNPKELAILCVMFLRGPQTPGELRTRTNRLYQFADVTELENSLQRLISREDGPYVVKLPREPGKRESRYAHLFSGDIEPTAVQSQHTTVVEPLVTPVSQQEERIVELERQVEIMRAEIDELKQQWEALNS